MEPFPAGPEQPYQPPTKGPAPSTVKQAITLIWVRVAVGLVSTAFTFLTIDDLVDDVMATDASITEDTARAAIIVSTIIGIAFSLGIAVLFVYFIGKGANWARIVYTVLTGIGVVVALVGLFGGQPIVLLLLGLASVVLGIATIVLLFRPESNAFFAGQPSRP